MHFMEFDRITGVYRGYGIDERNEVFNRGISEFESSMRNENPEFPQFDDILSERIQRAAEEGQQTVHVVDLGCGDNGFEREFLESSVCPGSKAALQDHPEVTLQFTGITDAQSIKEFLQAEPLQDVPQGQVTALRVPYSVTSIQPLSDAFRKLDIDEIDIAVAHGFFSHLQPSVFEQALTDTSDALSPGGILLVSEYGTVTGARLSRDDQSEPQNEPVTMLDADTNKPVGSDVLREEASRLLDDPLTTDEQFLEMARRITRCIITSGAMKTDILHFAQEVIDPDDPKNVRKLLEKLKGDVLTDAEYTIRESEMKDLKMGLLTDFRYDHQDELALAYTTNTFTVVKF